MKEATIGDGAVVVQEGEGSKVPLLPVAGSQRIVHWLLVVGTGVGTVHWVGDIVHLAAVQMGTVGLANTPAEEGNVGPLLLEHMVVDNIPVVDKLPPWEVQGMQVVDQKCHYMVWCTLCLGLDRVSAEWRSLLG